MAQTDVTKFLGIPVDGNPKEMKQRLKEKGFKQSPYAAEVLMGKFNGMDVHIHIVTNNDKVCRIMVADANTMDATSIKIRFNLLCEQFNNNPKYCSFLDEDPKIPEDENIAYGITVKQKRYEALFYQRLDTTAVNYDEEIHALVHSTYTNEQIENPSEEVFHIVTRYITDKTTKKPVWFMISEYSNRYYITMYYDNEYNRANGEDL